MSAKRLVTFALLAIVAATGSRILLADAPQAVGTWASSGTVSAAFTNGASVAMPDGRTVITGGAMADGTPTESVTIFDPADNSITSAGVLTSPRMGHTATLLKDGRVLVVGGIMGSGSMAADIELFDPAAGTATLITLLPEPRAGHVAARLLDGTVLIAGGKTIGGVALQTAAIFDPTTNNLSPLTGGLQVARVNASATTLVDGRVLVVGGSNDAVDAVDLASAEIYDRYSQTFTFAGTQLSAPRQGHSAMLLPHNGGVLIAGGTSNGVALADASLFLPAVFPDPFSYGEGEFASTGPMTIARSGAVAGPSNVEGYAFMAGGGSSDVEVYRHATIKTDRDDYAPGDAAVITGSGWQPGEEVTLVFQEDPAVHEDYVLHVQADGDGNIYWDQWAPEQHDLNVRFYLMASDSRSRAQTTFTDGLKVNVQRDSPSSATLNVAGGSTTPVTFRIENNNTNPNQSTSLTVSYALTASGVSVSGGSLTGSVTLPNNSSSVLLSWNVIAPAGPASGTVSLAATVTTPASCSPANACSSSAAYAVVVAGPSDSTAPVITPSITGTLGTNGWYTSNVNLSWTVTDPESAVTSSTGCNASSVTADTSGVTFTCSATSTGGTSSNSVTIKRDASAPNAPVGTKTPAANGAGWNNTAVTVSFASAGDNGPSGIASCTSDAVLSAETAGTNVNGTCADNAGNVSSPATVQVKIDMTAPVGVVGSASRGLDHGTWYNHSVDVDFTGTDDLSGIASCTHAPYSGPDAASAQVTGTCTDNAGNTSGSSAFTLNYDASAPNAPVGTKTPAANGAGWNNTAVTVSFASAGDNGPSGIASCTSDAVLSAETAGTNVNGTCADNAGNVSSPATVLVKIDMTAPVGVVGAASRGLDHGTWYNHSVDVDFTGTDDLSGIASCTHAPYSGPDAASAQVTGTCTDNAGNTSASSAFVLNYDASAPNAPVGTKTPAANGAGWNNTAVTVSFASAGDNGPSGIASCTSDAVLSAETAGTNVNGTCADNAGNVSSPATVQVKIDMTAPVGVVGAASRGLDHGTWYNHSVDVDFTGTDDLSGIASCTHAPYSGPDAASAQVTGTCTDNAGNTSGSSAFTLNYDASAPNAPVGTKTPAANGAGWNNTAVTVSFASAGDNGPSGIASCTSDAVLSAETAGTNVNGTCADNAGNVSSPATVQVKIDMTAPTGVVGSASRGLDHGTWYNHSVDVDFTATGIDLSGIASCTHATYSGPDAASAQVTGTCTDNAGNTSASSAFVLNYDASAPNAPVGTKTPAANGAGWNNTAVTVSFASAGDNGPSGIASCTSEVLSAETPSTGTNVNGTCVDNAGNVSSPATVQVKIDMTIPSVGVTGVSAGVYTLGAVPAAGCSTADSLSTVANAASLSLSGGVPPGVGIFTATCSGGTDKAGNVAPNTSVSYTVQFAAEATMCNGAPGRQVLQPINFTGSSVFPKKGGSTVPAKFRVCGVDGASIGPQQVVKNFVLYQILNGTVPEAVIEPAVESTNNDTAFRWSASDAQWIFNMSTKTLLAGKTYVYRIYLLDESFIQFQFGIK